MIGIRTRLVLRKAARIGAYDLAVDPQPANAVNHMRQYVQGKLGRDIANRTVIAVSRPGDLGRMACAAITVGGYTATANQEVTR